MTGQPKHALPESGFVTADGVRVFYRCAGDGPVLVLVHGWGADTQSNWVDTGWFDTLAPHRSLVSIDVRGHGRSDKPHAAECYSYAAMSADVLAVMDALEIERADFMGYSMGAFMGAYLLGHAPARFTAMVLGGIGDETPASAAQGEAIARALRAPDVAAIDDPLGWGYRRFVDAIPHNDLEALAFSALEMWPQGYPLVLAGAGAARADLPVLVVNGEQDHPYVDSADRFAAALANGRHVTLSGADHLTAVTDPRFKQTVLDFLTPFNQ